MKKFSCKKYFENLEKSKVFRKYYVDKNIKTEACDPDFIQAENEAQFAPEEHLKNVHGFLSNVPEKKRRSLEIELCKSIEETLV